MKFIDIVKIQRGGMSLLPNERPWMYSQTSYILITNRVLFGALFSIYVLHWMFPLRHTPPGYLD